jgi:hypothetical protein
VILPSVPPFIGRKEIVERFRSWLGEDEKPCFLVTGPSGSGRTRLLRRLVNEMRLGGRTVLAVTAPEAGSARPFDGAAACSRRPGSVASAPASPRGAGWTKEPHLLRTSSVEIRHFRRLRESWDARASSRRRDRRSGRRHRRRGRFDEISFRWVLFLAGRPVEPAVRFVLSRADGGAPPGADPHLPLGERAPARTEHLEPLDREEVRSWLRGTLGAGEPAEDLVGVAHASSGGNPARLDAIVRGWVRRGCLRGIGEPASPRAPPYHPGGGEPRRSWKQEGSGQQRACSVRSRSEPRLDRPGSSRGSCRSRRTSSPVRSGRSSGQARAPRGVGEGAVCTRSRRTSSATGARLIPDRRAKVLHRAAARLLEEEAAGGEPPLSERPPFTGRERACPDRRVGRSFARLPAWRRRGSRGRQRSCIGGRCG